MTMFKPKGKQEFKHPILDFADRRLFLGLVLLPILFDWPARPYKQVYVPQSTETHDWVLRHLQ